MRSLFDDDHEAFRDLVRRFLATEVVPHLDEWRAAGRVPDEVLLAAGANGLLGTSVPEEFGGGGTDDLLFTAVLVEETAAVGATGLALTFAVHSGACLPAVLEHASSDQQRHWLPLLAEGTRIGSAVLGVPVPVTVAADRVTLDAAVEGVSGGVYDGPVLVAVDVDGEERFLLLSGDEDTIARRAVRDSLGARDAGLADLAIRSEIGADALIADGPAVARVRADLDLWAAVLGVAAARAVLGMTLDYVRERKVFDRPLAEFENTRFKLAEVSAGIESAQLFVDDALRERAAGTLSAARAAMARLGAGSVHDQAVDQGMQLHGGYGYMREYPISHAFADARFLRNHGSTGTVALDAIAAGLGI